MHSLQSKTMDSSQTTDHKDQQSIGISRCLCPTASHCHLMQYRTMSKPSPTSHAQTAPGHPTSLRNNLWIGQQDQQPPHQQHLQPCSASLSSSTCMIRQPYFKFVCVRLMRSGQNLLSRWWSAAENWLSFIDLLEKLSWRENGSDNNSNEHFARTENMYAYTRTRTQIQHLYLYACLRFFPKMSLYPLMNMDRQQRGRAHDDSRAHVICNSNWAVINNCTSIQRVGKCERGKTRASLLSPR